MKIYGEIIKSLKSWTRNKVLVDMVLAPPIILTFIFVQFFTITEGSYFEILMVDEDTMNPTEQWTERFLEALESQEGPVPYFSVLNISKEKADKLFNRRKTFVILTIKEGFEQNLSLNNQVTIQVKYNNIHEDLSKNIRLGIEARLYYFNEIYQLETGSRPGINIDYNLTNEIELARPDYMMSGILVFVILYFTLITGGTLGSEEKEQGNFKEIKMSKNGLVAAKFGKIIATMLIALLMMLLLILLNRLFYGPYFPNFTSFLIFLGIFLSLAFIFSSIGVFYGMKVGDFRAIPAPSIIISITLWVLGGAINPLEFSAGSEIFKFLPTAASVRILTAKVFDRGTQYLKESWLILICWLLGAILLTSIYVFIKSRKESDRNP
ncbi:MAG: ABC transporter permease [Candidatus Thorarchaeota archaeon]